MAEKQVRLSAWKGSPFCIFIFIRAEKGGTYTPTKKLLRKFFGRKQAPAWKVIPHAFFAFYSALLSPCNKTKYSHASHAPIPALLYVAATHMAPPIYVDKKTTSSRSLVPISTPQFIPHVTQTAQLQKRQRKAVRRLTQLILLLSAALHRFEFQAIPSVFEFGGEHSRWRRVGVSSASPNGSRRPTRRPTCFSSRSSPRCVYS